MSGDADDRKPSLTTLELPFTYAEQDEIKSALVKVVLCEKCCKKLMWKRRKEKEEHTQVKLETEPGTLAGAGVLIPSESAVGDGAGPGSGVIVKVEEDVDESWNRRRETKEHQVERPRRRHSRYISPRSQPKSGAHNRRRRSQARAS